MEAVYDTEMETVEDGVAEDETLSSPENIESKHISEKSVDSVKASIFVEDTEIEVVETEDDSTEAVEDLTVEKLLQGDVVEDSAENTVLYGILFPDKEEYKTAEQAGFEIIVVFLLAFIAGLFLWDMLSKRWHV